MPLPPHTSAPPQLATLFSPRGVTILSAVETTATGNQPLAAVPPSTYTLQASVCVPLYVRVLAPTPLRVHWQGGGSVTLPVVPGEPVGPQLLVTLVPMAVRTFLCNVSTALY